MKRKAISCLLVLASVLTMTPSIPTLAAENQAGKTVVNETLADENQADKTLADETQTDGTSADGQQETNDSGSKAAVVKYDQASSFTVTIPKSIVLDSNKTATYNVKVKGDILGNEIITVVPDQTVTLNDANGKDPVTGNIAQEKTEFSSTEVNQIDGTKTNGNIAADDLTSGDWSGNFTFAINTNQIGDGISLTNSNLDTYQIDTVGDVVIPEYVTDEDNTRHAVTSIGDYAFRDCNEMTSVAIADSVTEIGTGAFANCSKLSSVSLPSALKTVKSNVFEGCSNLSAIQYKANSYDKTNIGSALTENNVTSDSELFEHTYGEPTYVWSEDGQTCTAKRTCVNHPSGVETEEATISSTVKEAATCLQKGTTTYTAAFKDTTFVTQTKDIQDIAALGHTPVNGYCTRCNEKVAGLYDANGVMLCSWEESGIDVTQNYGSASGENPYTTTPTSGYYVLTNNYPTATKVVIPSGITNIGSNAFGHYTNLTSVVIPDTVTSIGTWAFQMNGITSIDIPDSVTSIGRGAFYKCNNLTSVTMPSKITNISERLFDSCTSLQNVSIPENVTSIGYSAFFNTALTSITIPDNVKTVDYNAFKDCTSLKRVSIGSNIESISSGVFYGDTVLTNVTFNNCNKLTKIGKIYPDTTRYYYGVFQDCVSLQNVKIPESVTTIGDCTFNGCTSLDSVTYKGMDYDDSIDFELSLKTNNIETGDSVFVKSGISYTVLGLTNSYLSTCKIPSSGDIVIPKHVTGEDGIKYRIIRIGDIAFRDCTELTSVVIPDSVKAIGNATFEYCSKLTSIIIPNSVTSIGWNSFNGCSELTNITIPNSVTSIGDNAFSNCVKLSSINIPDNITNINWQAFSGCSNLSTVTYKGSVYKSKLELESALTSNGVTIGSDVFADTSLN